MASNNSIGSSPAFQTCWALTQKSIEYHRALKLVQISESAQVQDKMALSDSAFPDQVQDLLEKVIGEDLTGKPALNIVALNIVPSVDHGEIAVAEPTSPVVMIDGSVAVAEPTSPVVMIDGAVAVVEPTSPVIMIDGEVAVAVPSPQILQPVLEVVNTGPPNINFGQSTIQVPTVPQPTIPVPTVPQPTIPVPTVAHVEIPIEQNDSDDEDSSWSGSESDSDSDSDNGWDSDNE